MAEVNSPVLSFRGFKLSANFFSALKNVVFVLVPAILTEMITNNMITVGLASMIATMVLKAAEYFFKKYGVQ